MCVIVPSKTIDCKAQPATIKQEKTHAEWLEEQRAAVKRDQRKKQAAWVKRHQCTAGTVAGAEAPVQLGEIGFRDQSISLVLLVNEAANYQWQRGCGGLREKAAQAGGAAVAKLRGKETQKWEKLREAVVEKLVAHSEARSVLMAGKVDSAQTAEAINKMDASAPKKISKMLASRGMFQSSRKA